VSVPASFTDGSKTLHFREGDLKGFFECGPEAFIVFDNGQGAEIFWRGELNCRFWDSDFDAERRWFFVPWAFKPRRPA
jgi:hypothetical protein